MATLSALQTEILAYGFDSTAYSSRIATWLNEAQRIISRTLDLPLKEAEANITLLNGVGGYTLPSNLSRVLYVVNDTTDDILDPVSDQEYDSFDHNERGTPAYYYIYQGGVSIQLFPIPGPGNLTNAIRVHYVGLPTAMATGGDSSGLPADYDYVLKAYALQEAYAAEDDQQASMFWTQRFKERLYQMGEDLMHVNDAGPNQVQGSWNF